jgi:hydroxymethylbilane synthase
VLESGRSVPVGVHSELEPDAGDARKGKLRLVGTITALDGQRHVQLEDEWDVNSPEEGEKLGAQLATKLVELGGGEILGEITKDRERRAGEAEENALQAT